MAKTFRIKIKTKRKRLPPSRLQADYKKQFHSMLRKIAAKGIYNIRSEIKKRGLIQSGNLFKNITWKMTPQGVRLIATPDYAQYLDNGVKKHRMIYLTKATKPIPINAMNGIFRWATPKAIKNGAFVHPGFKRGKGFMKAGAERTRKDLAAEIAKIRFKVFS